MEFLIFTLGVVLYFLPAIIGRNKRSSGAIFVLNLLAGWSVIGWIVALVWACSADPALQPIVIQQAPQPRTIDATAVLCPGCGKYSTPGSRFCSSCGRHFGS